MKPGDLFIVRIETSRAFAPLVDAGLEALGMDAVAWYLDKRGGVRFEFYLESATDARERARSLRAALRGWARGEPWRVRVLRFSTTDWSEYWKRHFRTTRVSRRIVIKPSWAAYRAKQCDLVIEIDPGMAFGTGQHFSTASCLRLMENVVDGFRPRADAPVSLLDLGCGSGILAIAAAKLGFREVLAVDNDPVAVAITRQNVERNGVSAVVRARVTDLARLRLKRTFDVVVANMYSGILEKFASTIAGTVRRKLAGHLIVAGILTAQYPRIRQTCRRLGLREVDRLHDREWTSGVFRASPGAGRRGRRAC